MDSITLENELKKLVPIPLQDSLLDQLDDAMSDAANEISPSSEKIIVAALDTDLSDLEEGLRRLVPYGVPENLISRLDDAMSRWHEEVPVDEKIVEISRGVKRGKSSFSGIRSVAAVAILGAVVAIFSSNIFYEPDRVAERIPDLTNGLTTPVVFIPKNARASVVSAKDHGVVWTKGGQPLRCLEVHVNNKLQFVNERGEKLIIEQPKREVTFTPVKFD
jgi:hypothetical protein|tara:strand:- start:10095 stop:10751 length:657 start_codon:yes stop_codon:yes gene_type:complete